jgi:NAD(P)-dependent dehydrogenase (short-subunit alcohol dehydrogenase family)
VIQTRGNTQRKLSIVSLVTGGNRGIARRCAGSIAAAVRRVAGRNGKLDALVNNAAITFDAWAAELRADRILVNAVCPTPAHRRLLPRRPACPVVAAALDDLRTAL